MMAILKRDCEPGRSSNTTTDTESNTKPQLEIPMALLNLSSLQTTCINDILDHKRDAEEGSPNLVNFVQSHASVPTANALRASLLFHARTTIRLMQHVGMNPAGSLEKQAAQVAYGCYLMEVLHPRYSELAQAISKIYPNDQLSQSTADVDIPTLLLAHSTKRKLVFDSDPLSQDEAATDHRPTRLPKITQ